MKAWVGQRPLRGCRNCSGIRRGWRYRARRPDLFNLSSLARRGLRNCKIAGHIIPLLESRARLFRAMSQIMGWRLGKCFAGPKFMCLSVVGLRAVAWIDHDACQTKRSSRFIVCVAAEPVLAADNLAKLKKLDDHCTPCQGLIGTLNEVIRSPANAGGRRSSDATQAEPDRSPAWGRVP
jgi:hypothetical protein